MQSALAVLDFSLSNYLPHTAEISFNMFPFPYSWIISCNMHCEAHGALEPPTEALEESLLKCPNLYTKSFFLFLKGLWRTCSSSTSLSFEIPTRHEISDISKTAYFFVYFILFFCQILQWIDYPRQRRELAFRTDLKGAKSRVISTAL